MVGWRPGCSMVQSPGFPTFPFCLLPSLCPGRWSATELNVMAGYSSVHLAAIEAHIKVLEVLIAHGAELNEPVTNRKFTPVDLAMIEESEAAVQLLK